MAMAKTKSDNYWEPHARILESMPRFQGAIAEVRKRLSIPETGIPYDYRAEWFENFFHNADEDTASRYGHAYGYELLPPNKEFLDELDYLRAEFNLDPRWLHPLFNYIFTAEKSLEPPLLTVPTFVLYYQHVFSWLDQGEKLSQI
jgi:hypothetical protein